MVYLRSISPLPILLIALGLIQISCANDKGQSSSTGALLGNQDGRSPFRYKSPFGSFDDELSRFDQRVNQGDLLEPRIISESKTSTRDEIEAKANIDQNQEYTISLPSGYECGPTGASFQASGAAVILDQEPETCRAIFRLDSSLGDEGSVRVIADVIDSDGERKTLEYDVSVKDAASDLRDGSPALQNAEDEFDIADLAPPEDLRAFEERLKIGEINAYESANGSMHEFVFTSEIQPPLQFNYSLPSTAYVYTEEDPILHCQFEQNREYFGEADFVAPLDTEDTQSATKCPFKITNLDYDTGNIKFDLQFEEIPGKPGRFKFPNMNGVMSGTGPMQLAFEVTHRASFPATGQSVGVVQRFVLRLNVLSAEPDRIGQLNRFHIEGNRVYYRTGGFVSATEGFRLAREALPGLKEKYGEGIKFYPLRVDTLQEGVTVQSKVGALVWTGLSDIHQEGDWVWRDEKDDGSDEDYDKISLETPRWGPGEPNNRKNEDCMHLGWFGSSGLWNDFACYKGGVAVFELEFPDSVDNCDFRSVDDCDLEILR